MKKNNHTEEFLAKRLPRDYFQIGLTAFLVVAAGMLLFFILFRLSGIFAFLKKLADILKPIIIGFVIAYLLNPVYLFFRRNLTKLAQKKRTPAGKRTIRTIKGVSVAAAIFLFLLIIFVLCYMVLPQLYSSIGKLISDIPAEFDRVVAWINATTEAESPLSMLLLTVINYLNNWIEKDLPGMLNSWASYFATGVMLTVEVVMNFFVGIIVAVYVLNRKELFLAQTKKIISAVFPEKSASRIFRTAKMSHIILGGFINGKMIDSLIVGVLCFIGVTILNLPYSMLVSAVVCVTNIIPVFGPYIGGVPCAVLIALSDPIKGIYFVIFIILLQSLDGNIIGPRIIGETTGLNPFWVMFSILIGGGLFGIVGMIIGAPLFAVVYKVIKSLVESSLVEKGLSPDTIDYYAPIAEPERIDDVVEENGL